MNFSPELQPTPKAPGDWFEALIRLAQFLRSPEGCPWDREQGTRQFATFAKEEAEELCDALDEQDNRHAEEEFGDCFFTLVNCMVAAEEEGRFTINSALERAYQKMIRRHEHVFRSDRAMTPEEAVISWDKIKQQEREGKI